MSKSETLKAKKRGKNAMTNFEQYLENFMSMKKAKIIDEGIARGVWVNTESNKAVLMKWEKVMLARCLADRLVRLQNRGY